MRAERPTVKRAVEDEAPQEKRPRPLDAPRSADVPMGRRLMAKTPITTAKRRTTAVDLQEEKKKVRPLEGEEMCDAEEADGPHELRRRGSRRKRTEETAPWKGKLRRSARTAAKRIRHLQEEQEGEVEEYAARAHE